jgi:hypothetical protein
MYIEFEAANVWCCIYNKDACCHFIKNIFKHVSYIKKNRSHWSYLKSDPTQVVPVYCKLKNLLQTVIEFHNFISIWVSELETNTSRQHTFCPTT